MKRQLVVAGLVAVAAAAAVAGLPGPAAAAPPAAIQVTLDQSRVNTVLGARVTLRAQVTNSGTAPTDRLLADVNLASLNGVYVDLEDWLASRTRELEPLPPARARPCPGTFKPSTPAPSTYTSSWRPTDRRRPGRGRW
jgi:hypothetical protein